ncbi:MAG: ABC transporter permease [Gemmatimonadaceae bacterium]
MNSRFVVRRLLQVIPTVLGIVLFCFILIHAAPGDPIVVLAGEHGDAGYYAFMRERFGLDQPLFGQIVRYFSRVAVGDFGVSHVQGRATLAIIMERVPATLLLTSSALIGALILAVPLGTLAAQRPHGGRILTVNLLVVGLYSAPAFWIAQLAMLFLALTAGLFPVQGMTSAVPGIIGHSNVVDVLRHLALPAAVLALQELAVFVRLTQTGVSDELLRDHVRTARAKGASSLAVLVRHALPRALYPVVTVVGARVGQLIAGAVVIEIVFGWPGMGRLLLEALQTRDTPLLLGLFMLVSFTVVLANLATDLVYATVDPRVRHR